MAESKGDAPENRITIKVECSIVGHYDTVVYISIKKTSKLQKLMNAYCERTGFDIRSIRFLFNNRVISEMVTPSFLEMEDGSEIYVHRAQGGPDDYNNLYLL
ncbi:small ubiquitin-related modifier 3-like isoform X2 [Aphis gossypii]|uniref:small ubiquitin-related modifier 3-like isoform X2 n=1 Tax=Aphis gossypii TaxID=80765 RepID=UPI002158FF2D|nr:small ubiquitin-related modifier 3-like isoform X2 [Aphis gossypii]